MGFAEKWQISLPDLVLNIPTIPTITASQGVEFNSENSENSEHRGQKLKSIVVTHTKSTPHSRKYRRITPSMVENYKTGLLWLKPRLEVLIAAGWTPAELFGVSRLRFPYLWGIAWTGLWADQGVSVELTRKGFIIWRRKRRGREIIQSSRPKSPADGGNN